MTIFRSYYMNARISSREKGSTSLINTQLAPLEIFSDDGPKFQGIKDFDYLDNIVASNNFFVSYDEEEYIMSGLITPYQGIYCI